MKIYISVSDGGDGSYGLLFFKSQEDLDSYKERELAAYGQFADDEGGTMIDTDNLDEISWSKPEDIELDDEEKPIGGSHLDEGED